MNENLSFVLVSTIDPTYKSCAMSVCRNAKVTWDRCAICRDAGVTCARSSSACRDAGQTLTMLYALAALSLILVCP